MSGSSSEAATLFPPKVMIEPYSCPAITSLCGKVSCRHSAFSFAFFNSAVMSASISGEAL